MKTDAHMETVQADIRKVSCINTKTQELKQSGQPTSHAAENSSRSNKSSTFLTAKQSAFKKTHCLY